jgi:anti-sigma B factor antagonist
MNVSLRVQDSARVVDISGEIDLKGSPVLRKTLFDALREFKKVALNLSGIRYIDSSGIAVMIEALRESQRLNRQFVLFGMNPVVYDVFRLTHVIRIFQVADTEQQALEA